jgi:hypothetical protein
MRYGRGAAPRPVNGWWKAFDAAASAALPGASR